MTEISEKIAHGEEDDKGHKLTNDDFRRLLDTPRVSAPIETSVTHHNHSVTHHNYSAPQEKLKTTVITPEDDKAERRRKKKIYYAKLKKLEENKMAELAERYRDRAKERRENANPDYQAVEDPLSVASGYRAVAPDIKSSMDAAERRRQMIQESKYLGGDMEHTHLVKGLDYALLQKVKSEITTREQEQEDEMEKIVDKPKKEVKKEQAEVQFKTRLGRSIYKVAIPTKEIKRNELFAPGRMAYVIDLEEAVDTDIPTTLIRSKADVPAQEEKPILTTNDIVINKLAQILCYLRQGPRHSKKMKKKDRNQVDDTIFDNIGEYVPSDKRQGDKKKASNYFSDTSKRNELRDEERDAQRTKTEIMEKHRSAGLLAKLTAEPTGYAECYPGLEEMHDAIDDSDEEADYTKMDLGNKKGPVGRWDFDTQEEYSSYMGSKEAMPKAAFQYGVKMNDGRKTRKIHREKNEKAQLDKEWTKIQSIISSQKRPANAPEPATPSFKVPRY